MNDKAAACAWEDILARVRAHKQLSSLCHDMRCRSVRMHLTGMSLELYKQTCYRIQLWYARAWLCA